jgi:hypothetical protein
MEYLRVVHLKLALTLFHIMVDLVNFDRQTGLRMTK